MFLLYLTYANDVSIVGNLLGLKVITLFLIFYFLNSLGRTDFYYYKNLGLTRKLLWASTLSFDFLLFLFLMIIICMIK